jgi:hypothetical protein
MNNKPALKFQRLAWIVVAAMFIVVAVSGFWIFHWYLVGVDAKFVQLPPRGPDASGTDPSMERAEIKFPPNPANEVKARVFENDFQLIHYLNELPDVAKPLFKNKVGNRFAMADAGKPWQVGCVGDGDLPRERFIFGGISNNFAFAYFEHGGISHSHSVEVYRVSTTGWQPAWEQYVPGAAHNINQLRKLIAVPDNSN